MQITGKQGNYLKKDYSVSDILAKIADMKKDNYQISLILDCYEQPNTAYIGGIKNTTRIDFNSPFFYLKNFTSLDTGVLVENVGMYALCVRIREGPTNSKHMIKVFDNRDMRTVYDNRRV